jgi:hypothetical protein
VDLDVLNRWLGKVGLILLIITVNKGVNQRAFLFLRRSGIVRQSKIELAKKCYIKAFGAIPVEVPNLAKSELEENVSYN